MEKLLIKGDWYTVITNIITDITHNYSNSDVVKAATSATIHAFGPAAA